MGLSVWLPWNQMAGEEEVLAGYFHFSSSPDPSHNQSYQLLSTPHLATAFVQCIPPWSLLTLFCPWMVSDQVPLELSFQIPWIQVPSSAWHVPIAWHPFVLWILVFMQKLKATLTFANEWPLMFGRHRIFQPYAASFQMSLRIIEGRPGTIAWTLHSRVCRRGRKFKLVDLVRMASNTGQSSSDEWLALGGTTITSLKRRSKLFDFTCYLMNLIGTPELLLSMIA